MKKYLIALICSCGFLLFTSPVLADGEVTVYGYPYSFSSSSNLGAFTAGSIPGGGLTGFGGMSKEAYAQMIAVQAAGEAAAKKKYCKDNGYPTAVPFCAAQKEAKNKCLIDSEFTLNLCQKDAEAERTQRVDGCFVIYDVDVAQICHADSNRHAELRVTSCKEDKAVDDKWCESNY